MGTKIHRCTYIRIYALIHAYMRSFMHICAHIYVYAGVHAYMRAYIYIDIYAYMCVHMHLSPNFDWRLRDSGFQTNVVTQIWHGQPTRRGHSHFQQNWGDYRPAPSNETDSNGMPTLQVNVHRACFCLGSFHSLLEVGGRAFHETKTTSPLQE